MRARDAGARGPDEPNAESRVCCMRHGHGVDRWVIKRVLPPFWRLRIFIMALIFIVAMISQDALYIHDTIELFGASIGELRTLWRDVVRPQLPDITARRVEALSVEHFAGVSDVVRAAARIPSDRVLGPERIQQVCAYGLNQVFGAP